MLSTPAAENGTRNEPFLPLIDISTLTDHQALQPLRHYLRQLSEYLRARFLAGEDAVVLVHERAHCIDQLLSALWRWYEHSLGENRDCALVAVGGYGRGELHPGSDVDLLILLQDPQPERYQVFIEQFIAVLWDIGLEVGHSTRTLTDCVRAAEQDITIATNLMESRLIAGSATLYQGMLQSVGPDQTWPSRHFFEAKLREQIARHQKFHNTEYNLEPNIKEGPGGLRDIQMIGWVAKRHFGATTLQDLVTHGFLTQSEYEALHQGQSFLWKIRFALHTLAGRREDRLLFDYQRPLADQFGYIDKDHRLAVEHFMKDYYVTVIELSRLNEMLLQLFKEAILYADDPELPVIINNRFQARRGFIEIRHEKTFKHYPFALLEIFLLLQQHPDLKGVRAATIRSIRDHRYLIDDKFRNDLRNRSLFMEILKQPSGITHELRRMNRYGVLAAYMPVFGKIVGLMQYDLFHVYTVDEHILRVVRNLRRFTVPEFAHEFPFCSQLIQNIPKLEILYLAGLFHDIAKGRGGDHSNVGAQETINFCLHHGMSQYDARFVGWLVKHHLVMSSTAQRQDISDPKVITAFAMQVSDQTHLDYLYLLTVADICGTNPNLWNSWKGALLMELYTCTKRALRRGLENPIDKAGLIAEIKNSTRAILKDKYELGGTTIDEVWSNFNEDYFLRHSPDEIAWHTGAIADCRVDNLPLILIREETPRGGTEIFLYMKDQENLFATTTKAFDQLGLNILDARIITTQSGFVLDTYIVLEDNGEPVTGKFRSDEIITKLQRDLTNKYNGEFVMNRRPHRRLRHFAITTEVIFSTDVQNNRTVMELIAADRPGLLSRVGRALVECDVAVQNAKIATFGERVEDVFFLTDENQQPLKTAEQFKCLTERIERYLEPQI